MNPEAKHVLIVDDETVIVDVVAKMCQTEGFKVDKCYDAETALEIINKNKYELIVCDIMLPQMDGFQLLDELSKRQLNIPVIMITGFSTLENAVKSLSMGAIDFIPKPFTYEEIISSIHRGMKYYDIKIKPVLSMTPANDLEYVPCPSKYYKLGYSSWIREEIDGTFQLGILDLFIKTVEDFSKIELLELEDEIFQGSSCIKLVSDEYSHPVLAPLSGKILERNEKVTDMSSLLEKDPYFEGWIYRIIPKNFEYEKVYLTPCSTD
jgi:CheY-like chemotaxis protein/glycine cleavage system H lipoate-binding protein